MTREEKIEVVKELSEQLAETPNIYLADAGGLTVAQVNELRGRCHKAGIQLRVVKNTLMKIALDGAENNYEEVYDALKEQTSVFFVKEEINGPAKIIKDFRKKEKTQKPLLKAAYIDEAVFFGDENLEALTALKSKNELIADVIALLQAPMMNLLGAVQSGGNTVSGLLKALEERGEGN